MSECIAQGGSKQEIPTIIVYRSLRIYMIQYLAMQFFYQSVLRVHDIDVINMSDFWENKFFVGDASVTRDQQVSTDIGESPGWGEPLTGAEWASSPGLSLVGCLFNRLSLVETSLSLARAGMRAALVSGAERGRGGVRARDPSDTRQVKICDRDCQRWSKDSQTHDRHLCTYLHPYGFKTSIKSYKV